MLFLLSPNKTYTEKIIFKTNFIMTQFNKLTYFIFNKIFNFFFFSFCFFSFISNELFLSANLVECEHIITLFYERTYV